MNKYNKSIFITFLILILCISFASSSFAATSGDAVYRTGAGINNLDHTGIFSYGDGGQELVYEIKGADSYGVNLYSFSSFLGSNTYLGAFTTSDMTLDKRTAVLKTAADLDAETDIEYVWYDMLNHISNPGYYVSVSEITHIRCDGVPEYAYEWNNIWVWGKSDTGTSSGTPHHFDVSYTAYVEEHNNLGKDQPWFESSPYVQRGGSGTKWTKMR